MYDKRVYLGCKSAVLQEKYSRPGAGDQLSVLQAQVDDVTGIMTQNIERVLERGERLDDLMNKTEDLEASVSSIHALSLSARNLALLATDLITSSTTRDVTGYISPFDPPLVTIVAFYLFRYMYI